MPVSALWHSRREILVREECTELGFCFSKQDILERKYLNLGACFFTWLKYTGNTMKTIVIIIVNMRNNRFYVAASLRILPLFPLQMLFWV